MPHCVKLRKHAKSSQSDVIKRSRQLILVLRECVTSFTATTLIDDEQHTTLRYAIIRLCVQMRPLDGQPAVVRTDPAPGFKALTDDQLLKHNRITIDLGHAKNQNKNPVAERAVQELEIELLRPQAAQAQNVRSFFFFHFDANAQCSVTYGIYYITTNSTTRKRDVSIWRCCLQRFEFIKVCMGSQRLF